MEYLNVSRMCHFLIGALLAGGGMMATAFAADAPTVQPASTRDAAALSKARAIGTTARKVKKFYTKEFDLSGLPSYKPAVQITGTIRQWGNNYLKDSGLIDVWEAEFKKFQPGAQFDDYLSAFRPHLCLCRSRSG